MSVILTIAVGTVLGFLSGLGIGGGSLLMLWLTVILSVPYPTARGINLLFFLPCAVIACRFRKKQGLLNWRKIFPAILAGCIAAALFSWIGTLVQLDLLKKVFGVLLIATGIKEVLYRPKKNRAA